MKHYQQNISVRKEFDLPYDMSLIEGTPKNAADNGASKELTIHKQTELTRPRNKHNTGLLVFAYLFGKRQVYLMICTIC